MNGVQPRLKAQFPEENFESNHLVVKSQKTSESSKGCVWSRAKKPPLRGGTRHSHTKSCLRISRFCEKGIGFGATQRTTLRGSPECSGLGSRDGQIFMEIFIEILRLDLKPHGSVKIPKVSIQNCDFQWLYATITPQDLLNLGQKCQPAATFQRLSGTACGKNMMPCLKYSTPERRAPRKPGADSW